MKEAQKEPKKETQNKTQKDTQKEARKETQKEPPKECHKEIHLGRILIRNRHKRGITQEDLAAYIGVSKASVSKWETGATYPDITLLPQLAAYFDISIDELMGYEPQMAKEDIRKLHRQLSQDFSNKPFEEVMNHCREIAKKYFSCAPLLFQIGSLYVNHCMLAATPQKSSAAIEEARGMFVRVQEVTDDMDLKSQSIQMEACCLLQLGQAQEVLDLLMPSETRIPSEPLLAAAWQMLGNKTEAKSILQSGIYQTMLELLNQMLPYAELCTDDRAAFAEAYARTQAVSDIFRLETLHPGFLMGIYHSCARSFLALGEKETALGILEKYAGLAAGSQTLHLHGDSFFNLIDGWLEQNLALGNDLPRDDAVIRSSMVDAVAMHPAFASLCDDPRFQNIVRRLKSCRKERP